MTTNKLVYQIKVRYNKKIKISNLYFSIFPEREIPVLDIKFKKNLIWTKGFEVYQNLGYQHDENTEAIPGSMSSKATKV